MNRRRGCATADREEDEAGVVDGASRLRSSTVVHVGGHALPPGQDGAAGGGRGGGGSRWRAPAWAFGELGGAGRVEEGEADLDEARGGYRAARVPGEGEWEPGVLIHSPAPASWSGGAPPL